MIDSLPPEILCHILSFSIDQPDQLATSTIQLDHQIQEIANFQSLCNSINSNTYMIKYFADFWIKVAIQCFPISGLNQEAYEKKEKLSKLISNIKEDHKRKILLARYIKNLQLKEEIKKKNNKKNHYLKLNIFGEDGVGKSATFIRYVSDRFMENDDPIAYYTKVVEFAGSSITLDITTVEKVKPFELELEKTSLEKRRISRFRNAHCFIVISSIDNYQSLTETREIATFASILRLDSPIIFAINKIDLVSSGGTHSAQDLLLFTNEIKSIIKDLELTNTSIIECSAKTSHNINLLFEESIRRKYYADINYVTIIENVIEHDSKCLNNIE